MSITMSRSSRLGLGLVATAVAAGGALAPMASAHAAVARNGVCDPGEFCYAYNSNFTGSVSDFSTSVADYGTTQPTCFDFKSAGAGKGLCVKNHAASVWNRTTKPVTVFFNSGYAGARQVIPAGAKVNLNATLKNQNASHVIGTLPQTTGYTPHDDYPWPGIGKWYVDPWAFYKGECVSFAAWRVNHTLHIPFTNNWHGQHFGYANHWATAARGAGLPVDTHPRAGDIAVRTTGVYGHVAFVDKVNPNGSFVIEEYNHVATHRYSTRTATVGTGSNQFNYFIHFKG